jgi:alpha-beta hydrolase superfamily lysophospholipase
MAVGSGTFEDSLAQVRARQHREAKDTRLNPHCRSTLLEHGHKTERVAVFLHGITSSPLQFHELGAHFHARGYNVLIPRMPRHGYSNRLTTDHGKLTSAEYKAYAADAVEMAEGLGENLTLAGLSVSGVITAWGAQTLAQVDLAVLIAPAFAPPNVPLRILPVLTRLALRLPNLFLWWDFRQRERLGPACSYPRFSTHALGECFKLGLETSYQAGHTQPASRSILAVTNAHDKAVNNAATRAVLDQWRSYGTSTVRAYEFGRDLGRLHDFIGPYQPEARVDVVYPILFDLINARA